jgi:TRAP transporter 4TM/12TM fusion protein
MFTPPVMGAGAFIMAEYLEMPYIRVAIAAALPAFLFYYSVLGTVYLKAVKSNIPALPKEQIPNLLNTLKQYGHLMPPVFILVGLLLRGSSLMWAAFSSIVALVVLSMLRKLTRMSLKDIIEALGDATQKTMPVAVACAAAGIIYGVISATGVGFKISSTLVALAGANKFMVLVLSMLSGIMLGFAMPPTAAYVILAALIVPSLQETGLPPLAAHMFLFIFCCIGPITPPVALAAYSAAGIADSDPNKTGFTAFGMGMAAYIIPFLFVYSHQLLTVGSFATILSTTFVSLIGITLLVIAIEGYFIREMKSLHRALLFAIVLLIFVLESMF